METKEFIIESKKHGTHKILVDGEDYDMIRLHRWHLVPWSYNDTKFYVGTKKDGKNIKIHRLIMGFPAPPLVVDHINGNTFDNRKCNLRICAQQENIRAKGKQKNNTSGYVGVYLHRNKWRAQIKHNNRRLDIGHFDCKFAAARARDLKAIEFYGEHAYTNFPKEDYKND